MQYRDFGRTGERISLLGFGAMRLPYAGGKIDIDASVRLIHRALELGVNYVDTAPGYCDGDSEIAVGEAVRSWKGPRPLVSSKNPIENASGDDWRRRLEKTLGQLKLDHVDFYHMWGIGWKDYTDSVDVPGGPLEAARKAKEEGLVRHLSFSFHDDAENMFKIVDTGVFETVLCQYNLLDRANEAAMAHARRNGLGVVVMGPVAGGRLGAPSEAIRKLLPGTASSASLALRFVMANPDVSCALSGMETLAQVEENAAVASDSTPLSSDELARIKASMEENRKLADLYCTGCKYCMPCPFEVNIPLNFELMNYHRVYGLTDYARKGYAEIGANEWNPGKKASECTQCGVCEPKCPQHIRIRLQLAETAAALG